MINILAKDILEQIDFESLLFLDRELLANVPEERLEDEVWKRLELLLYRVYKIPKNEETDFCFLRTLDRKDYAELFWDVHNQCSASKIVINALEARSPISDEKAYQFLVERAQVLYQYISEENPKLRQCLFLTLVYLFYSVDALLTNSFKVLVVFADMQPLDHLAVAVAKILGIKTVTLQHGLYVDYTGYQTVNSANYLNQNADYFLAWGRATQKLIERYNSKTIVLNCGKPRLSRGFSTPENDESTGHILVVLDQPSFIEQNMIMLEIIDRWAQEQNREVRIKVHPMDDRQGYFRRFPKLKEGSDFSSASIVVGHTTTLLFEALSYRIPVIQFVSNVPTVHMPASNQFRTYEGLVHITQQLSVDEKVLKHYFKETGTKSLTLYKQAFELLRGMHV